MTKTKSTIRYFKVAMLFHWSMAILIILNILGGLLKHYEILDLPIIIELHTRTGIIILTLAILRIFWRLTHKYPSLTNIIPNSEKILAYFSHLLLYVLMIAVPVSGMLFFQSIGEKVYFLQIELPKFIMRQPIAEAKKILNIHQSLALIFLTLIVYHILAALKHHFIDKNHVLSRMLPKWIYRK